MFRYVMLSKRKKLLVIGLKLAVTRKSSQFITSCIVQQVKVFTAVSNFTFLLPKKGEIAIPEREFLPSATLSIQKEELFLTISCYMLVLL